MSTSSTQLIAAQPLDSAAYHRLLTRLGDIFAESGEAGDAVGGYSLFKDLAEVSQRYQHPELIGQGGMKRIFRVFDRLTGREVALAIIHNLASSALVEQFIVEARITARLEHPNIMPVYDFGLDDKGEPFFTMKLIRGETLGEVLRRLEQGDRQYRHKYPLAVLLDVLGKVCDAVAYAHDKGVLHLDLKPDNIQIGSFGEVLVCDWGISRRHSPISTSSDTAAAGGSLTVHGQVNGTLGYMPPEQATKPRRELTPVSDIYALGGILYHILTGQPPIRRGSVEQMLADTVAHRIVPLKEAGKGRRIPDSLAAVCRKAMHQSPARRYQRVDELKVELTAFRGGFATRAENAGFFRNLWLLMSRHRALSGTVLASLMLMVLLAAGAFVSIEARRQEAERQREKAEQRLGELTELKLTEVAPAKQRTAELMYRNWDFEAAEELLRQVVEMDPRNLASLQLQGFIYLGARKFKQARDSFDQAGNPKLQKYITLCDAFLRPGGTAGDERLPEREILELVRILHEDGNDPTLGQLLLREGGRTPVIDDKLQLSYRVLSLLNPLENRIRMDCNVAPDRRSATVSLCGNPNLNNITGLIFLPLAELDLSGTKVVDLNPLRLMPLERLNLAGTPVSNLEPVAKCPLKRLDISRSNVVSLAALRGSLLEELVFYDIETEDLDALRDCPNLRQIELTRTPFNAKAVRQAGLPTGLVVKWRAL